MEKLSETEHIPTVDNCPNVVCSTVAEVPKLKKAANEAIAENYLDYWNEVAKDLIVQGDFLRLLAEEDLPNHQCSHLGSSFGAISNLVVKLFSNFGFLELIFFI